MKDKDYDQLAAVEKAIAEKYGEETVSNPRANWDEKREKDYLKQMKELYSKVKKNEEQTQKVDINGIKVSKKLLNREQLRSCPICARFPRKSLDDVCLLKYDCCNKCYIQYVQGREQRWEEGWRPEIKKDNK
tara:strand:- start:304 stop:699 length:396 start_codon:yes stop_codon:yes gene_type:complete